jgi:hypothetical protein
LQQGFQLELGLTFEVQELSSWEQNLLTGRFQGDAQPD